MPIHHGPRGVGKIYHGSKAIKAAYRGSIKVWEDGRKFTHNDDFERSSLGSFYTADSGAGITGTAPRRQFRRTNTATGASSWWTRDNFDYNNFRIRAYIGEGHDRNQYTSIIIGSRDELYYFFEFTDNRGLLGEYDGVRWNTLNNPGGLSGLTEGDRVEFGGNLQTGELYAQHYPKARWTGTASFILPKEKRKVGGTFRTDRVFIASFYSPGFDILQMDFWD